MNKLSNCSTPSPVSESLWVTVPSPKASHSTGEHLVLGFCSGNPAVQVPFLELQLSAKAFTCLPSLFLAPRQTTPASHGFQEENCTSSASIRVSGLGTLHMSLCAYRHIHFQLLSLPKILLESSP